MKRLVCTLVLISLMMVSLFGQDSLKAVLVKDIRSNSSINWSDNSSFPRHFVALPDRLLFMAASSINSNFHDLWATDGTAEGTRMVTTGDNTLGLVDVLDGFTAWGSQVIFTANDGARGYEPWLTDGTPGSARLLQDIKSGSNGFPMVGGSEPRYYRIFKDKVYFQAEAGSNHQLFVSDGTEAGTRMLTPGTGDYDIFGFVAFQDRLFFSCQKNYMAGRLWVTDGTVEGTREFKSIDNGEIPSFTKHWAIVYRNKLYFAASTAAEGKELWVSDGTPEGTRLWKDINKTSGQGSHPHGFTLMNDRLYFIANDGIHGNELWCMDADSAWLVKDIGPNGGALDYAALFVDHDRLFMAAQAVDGFAGLWVSDGTPDGTQPLLDYQGNTVEAPSGFTPWKGRILFVGGQYNKQLWMTDGSASGTLPVFAEAQWSALGEGSSLASFKGDIYFGAHYSDPEGGELYKLMVDSAGIRPTITQQPLSQTICPGDTALLEVKATGRPDFGYQWMKDEVVIENATASSYVLAGAGAQASGNYTCLVKNSVGQLKSETAHLEVASLVAAFEVIDSTKAGYYSIRFTGEAPSAARYHWTFDGGIILAGSGRGPYRVAWSSAGPKAITLELALNSCADVATKTAEVIATDTNIQKESALLSMFPNPAGDELTLKFKDNTGNKQIQLFDAHGHRLLHRQTQDSSLRLDLSRLKPGMYYIRVQDKTSQSLQKLVKK